MTDTCSSGLYTCVNYIGDTCSSGLNTCVKYISDAGSGSLNICVKDISDICRRGYIPVLNISVIHVAGVIYLC